MGAGELTGKVALVTGAARRVGATTVTTLHRAGANIVLHYRQSSDAAERLSRQLLSERSDSVVLLQGELTETEGLAGLAEQANSAWGRIDLLVNNASSFYPTPIGTITEMHWDDLIGTNLKAPLFLAQAVAPYLRENRGSIVNIVDIHAQRPLKSHTVYCLAKAGLAMLTQSLALELGPEVRVNGVAPGAILWPEQGLSEAQKGEIVDRTFLKRQGTPEDIARTVLFLARDADYISGEIIAVDGGRSKR